MSAMLASLVTQVLKRELEDDLENEPDSSQMEIFSSWALFIMIMLLMAALFTSYMLQQKRVEAVHETVISIFAGMTVGLMLRLSSGTSIQNLVSFNYQIFFNLLLPPIILASGYELHQANFFRNIGTILTFALPGTFISAMVLGLILWVYTRIPIDGFDMSFVDAISVGATLSATDPVTILAIFNTYKVDPKLYTIIFGESMLNDAVAIVLFETAQRYKEGGAAGTLGFVNLMEGIGIFLIVFFGSLMIGVIVGIGTALVLKWTYVRRFPKIESCLIVLIAYASYFFSNGLHMSGIVTLLFCGITLKHYAYYNMSRRTHPLTFFPPSRSELSSPNAHGEGKGRRGRRSLTIQSRMEQLKTIGRELAMGSQGGFGQSKEFLDLVKSIGESRSKAEEDRIVLSEIDILKRKLLEPDVPKRKMKEYIIRLVYIEMLGHDASFGYIHAVKMTHDDNLLLKRTGYLAVTLFLDEDHDLIILIVNTIQKDLRSDNYLVVCAALNAVCRLINEETIPAVLPQVVDLLNHGKEAVRKKAIMALHRFHRKSPSSVSHLVSNFRRKLCDSDPGVMGATLCPLFDLISEDVASYKDLVSSFVGILKQVTERKLPKSYDYHQMPAPFIQIKLLKIMALLSSGDKSASEMMYMVLGDLFRKCDSSTNIGNAILYECIRCISCIIPSPKLLEDAAEAISKFLKSDSHNLKYMGIDGLGRLIKISSDIAEQHQLAVIDCLEDPDDTLKRKTFELLYKMTKSSNVEVIVDRMIDYMISINDNHYKTEIASRCVELAEQFAPSNQWFIQIMNKVFEHAGDLVNIKVAHNLMRLIAEGFGEDDDDADNKLRLSAVESYLQIISEPKLPSLFLQVISWVLGEYGTADGKYSASYISGKLCDVADAYSSDETVKGYAVSALMKIYAFEIASGRKVDVLPECQSLIEELLASHSTDLQQRAYELQALLALDARAVESILPLDASCEDIEVDKDLSFLNGYIQQAIESGAQPYVSERERSGGMFETTDYHSQDHHEVTSHALRFEAYELPKPSVPSQASVALVPVPEPSYYSEPHQPISTSSSVSERESSEIKLRLDGVKQKWGRPSYQSSTSASSSTPPQAANGTSTHSDGGGVASSSRSKPRSSYESKKPEIDPEKQRLAASLFGGSSSSSRSDRKSSSGGHKPAKGTANKPATVPKVNPIPVPDLLDFDEPTGTSDVATTDPFKELEGLMESSSQDGGGSTDVMGLYSTEASAPVKTTTSVDSLLSELSDSSRGTYHQSQTTKGPNSKEALEKDALVRQMGVNPTSQNPTLFKDLLG